MSNTVVVDARYMKHLELKALYAPETYDCRKCGEPYASGYICTFCNDSNPSSPKK